MTKIWQIFRSLHREMEYIEHATYITFNPFLANSKSIGIYRVFRCCVLLKNKNVVSHEMG